MDRLERFQRIDDLIKRDTVVPRATFLRELDVSAATFKRDLEYMRDRFNAPIVYDAQAGGYRFEKPSAGPAYQLPGLWFNAGEVYALLTMQQLLSDLQPGLLDPHIAPLKARLKALLESSGDHTVHEIERRFKVLHAGRRDVEVACFETVSRALLDRQRLRIVHYHRLRDERTERIVSPQQLVFYRDNWYLDAWCHLREGLRAFALDAIESAEVLSVKAKNVSKAEIDRVFGAGYGIFNGDVEPQWATIRFSPERSKWAQRELWHPMQKVTRHADGAVTIEVPFTDERELVMDVLRAAEDAEVVAPAQLRLVMIAHVSAMRKLYVN